MEGPERTPWFAGDLADPWVGAIADALPRALRIDCPGDLPDAWPSSELPPSAVIAHRSVLTQADASRIGRLRTRWEHPPRLVLCVGPQARYVDVERWSRLVDAVIPEATAPGTIARVVGGRTSIARGGRRPKAAIVSANHELRAALADACRSGGIAAEPLPEWAEVPPGVVVAWDVPGLEPDWPDRLARRAKSSPVVALIGFPDRSTVALARDRGASACLELPCNVDDLIDAIERVASIPADPAHEVPPPPVGWRTTMARRH